MAILFNPLIYIFFQAANASDQAQTSVGVLTPVFDYPTIHAVVEYLQQITSEDPAPVPAGRSFISGASEATLAIVGSRRRRPSRHRKGVV